MRQTGLSRRSGQRWHRSRCASQSKPQVEARRGVDDRPRPVASTGTRRGVELDDADADGVAPGPAIPVPAVGGPTARGFDLALQVLVGSDPMPGPGLALVDVIVNTTAKSVSPSSNLRQRPLDRYEVASISSVKATLLATAIFIIFIDVASIQ